MLTQQTFHTASSKTPQYLAWFRLFKKEFTKHLVDNCGVLKSDIEIGKPNHFDMSGFFKKNDQWIYFRIGDLRWNKNEMLIRIAKSNKDYSGGSNNYIILCDYDHFVSGLDKFLLRFA